MANTVYDFSDNERFMTDARYKFYSTQSFKEMCEQLNIEIQNLDGRIILTGSQSALEQIETEFKEFEQDYKQPGDSKLYREQSIAEELSKYEVSSLSKGSLDSILSEKNKAFSLDVEKENVSKLLKKANIYSAVKEKEEELSDIEEEIEELRKQIIRKAKILQEKLKREEGNLKDKVNLILNHVITDPDEIASTQENIDNFQRSLGSVAKQFPHLNDLVEDLDRSAQDFERKSSQVKEIKNSLDKAQSIKDDYEESIRQEKMRQQQEEEEEEEQHSLFGIKRLY